MISVKLKKLNTAKLLIEKGININNINNYNKTALMMAEDAEIFNLLLKNNADINPVESQWYDYSRVNTSINQNSIKNALILSPGLKVGFDYILKLNITFGYTIHGDFYNNLFIFFQPELSFSDINFNTGIGFGYLSDIPKNNNYNPFVIYPISWDIGFSIKYKDYINNNNDIYYGIKFAGNFLILLNLEVAIYYNPEKNTSIFNIGYGLGL